MCSFVFSLCMFAAAIDVVLFMSLFVVVIAVVVVGGGGGGGGGSGGGDGCCRHRLPSLPSSSVVTRAVECDCRRFFLRRALHPRPAHHACCGRAVITYVPSCGQHGCQVGTYDHAKQFILRRGWLVDGFAAHCAASMVAGAVAAVATSPVDVIKTRLMNQKRTPGADGKVVLQYRSSMHCVVQIARTEGLYGFYKGACVRGGGGGRILSARFVGFPCVLAREEMCLRSVAGVCVREAIGRCM